MIAISEKDFRRLGVFNVNPAFAGVAWFTEGDTIALARPRVLHRNNPGQARRPNLKLGAAIRGQGRSGRKSPHNTFARAAPKRFAKRTG